MEFKEFRQNQQVITERFKNLFFKDTDERLKYADEVWNLLQQSYKAIGGIKGNGFQSKEKMIEVIPFWKLTIRNGKVTTVAMYKDKGGRKRVAIATDGSKQAKADLANSLKDELKTGRAFAEVSGPSLRFIEKQFTKQEMAKFFVPFDIAKLHFPDEELRPIDDFKYQREIGGEWHEKVMIGNPKAPRITQR